MGYKTDPLITLDNFPICYRKAVFDHETVNKHIAMSEYIGFSERIGTRACARKESLTLNYFWT